MTEVLGLTPRQHRDVGRSVQDGRNSSAQISTVNRGTAQGGLLRVIAPSQPSYQPGQPLECPIFEYDDSGNVYTVYMTGTGLRGNLAIEIDGNALGPIDARSTQDELRGHVADALPGWIVSVWEGVWEFDGRGHDQYTINVTPEEAPDEPPPDFVSFDGGLQVIAETWASVKTETPDGPEHITEETFDALPYTSGSVAASAIGLCQWWPEVGWVPIAWQCRDVSYHVDGDDA